MPSTLNALEDLGKGLKSLHENPFIVLGGKQVSVTMSSLNNEELATLFMSAGITLRVAASFQLDWSD